MNSNPKIGSDNNKICIITSHFCKNARGGIQRELEGLINQIENQYNISILTKTLGSEIPNCNYSNVKIYPLGEFVPYSSHESKLVKVIRFIVNETINPVIFYKIYAFLKKEKPNIVFIGETLQLSLSPILCAKLLRIPMIIRWDWICPAYPKNHACTIRDRIYGCGECVETFYHLRFNSWCRMFFGAFCSFIYIIKKKLWNSSYVVIVDNLFFKELYSSWGINSDNIKIISGFSSLEKNIELDDLFKSLYDKNYITFAYVGRITPEKGICLLLEAFNNLCQQYNNLRLIIAGDGILKTAVEKESLKNEKIIYLGWLEKDQLSMLYSIADVIVIPSIVPEGHSVTAQEAISFDKTILAFNHGGLSEICASYPFSIPVNEISTASLFRSMEKFIKSN
ncbi:glycosyltransferase family 4 protein [Methanosarcina hadiensis]|uniref:glycosyltransferase family 4 protein n=1 Tax=Methanosarcina hadiensis TaxID=3078083 RepID=UPI0039778C75